MSIRRGNGACLLFQAETARGTSGKPQTQKTQTGGETSVIESMTGFATAKGAALGASWAWDLRSVNGKGLDLRLRVPDWIDGL